MSLCVSVVNLKSDISQQFVDANLAAGFFINLLDDYGTVQAVLAILGRQVAGNNH